MYNGKRILGVITARGGSKGIPRKNVIDVAGKPLIGWTIDAAKGAQLLDRVVLSSDDDEIIQVARQLGCEVPFKRALSLASDSTTSMDVVFDCLAKVPGYDYVVLLQPTSPLRTSRDIDGAIRLCLDKAAPACVSVCEVEENPHWMYSLGEAGDLAPLMSGHFTRRQDLPAFYRLNGAVYVADVEWLKEAKSFLGAGVVAWVMSRSRSIDIDLPEDLIELARLLEEI